MGYGFKIGMHFDPIKGAPVGAQNNINT